MAKDLSEQLRTIQLTLLLICFILVASAFAEHNGPTKHMSRGSALALPCKAVRKCPAPHDLFGTSFTPAALQQCSGRAERQRRDRRGPRSQKDEASRTLPPASTSRKGVT